MKRRIALLLAAALVLVPAVSLAAERADRSVSGGIFFLTSAEDFRKGTLDALSVEEAVGDGALKLDGSAPEGTYTSDVIGTEPFEYLVASWNADVPKGASVEILARAYVDQKSGWSAWSSWGEWKPEIRRASTNDDDPLSYMDVDTLTIKGSSGETASLVQMKAVLRANEAGESPVLRQIAATYKNTLAGQAIKPVHPDGTVALPERVQLDTPAYSQGIRERSIASSMCSATTIAVLLNDRGEDVLPEEIALICYDSVYEGFGNWPFSVAAAGAYGYNAYCQYADLDVLRQELARGYSVGLSVKYANYSGSSYPYLEGAPISSTNGHLITLTGYETVDGVDYFYSSDSAASDDPGCLVRYRADQLDAAWAGRLAYIVHDKEPNAVPYQPNRVKAELVRLEGEEDGYALYAGGEPVAINKNLSGIKLRAPGGGIIAYFIEEAEAAAMPDTAASTTANRIFRYAITAGENFLRIEPDSVLNGVSGKATLHIFVMMNDGVTYETTLELDGGAPAGTPAPTDPPALAVITAPPEATQAVAASAEGEDGGSRLPVWLYAAAAIAVILLLLLIFRKRKR